MNAASLIAAAADLACVPMPSPNVYRGRLGAVAHETGNRDRPTLPGEQARASGREDHIFSTATTMHLR